MNLTKRGVLYIGYACNLACKFCYYHYTGDKTWKKLYKAKIEAFSFRHFYGNNKVDITGGEPTIYPHINNLVKYCTKIGIRPSIITNGIALAKEQKVVSLKEAGVYDYLVSVHGLGEVYNSLVKLKNAAQIQEKAIENLIKHNIPIRINVTINKYNLEQLKDIVKYAHQIDAKVVNFICFNPFGDWIAKKEINFQEKHTVIEPYLKDILDFLNRKEIEANLRYFPFCLLKGYEKHQYNFRQVSFDPHEWDFMSRYRNKYILPAYFFSKIFKENGSKKLLRLHFKEAQRNKDDNYFKSKKCAVCSYNKICDGLTKQYHDRYGDDELQPYEGDLIIDPTTFIKTQYKIID